MATDNVVTLVGNITDDPELRFKPSGAAVANFTVAVIRRMRTQSGEWEDRLDGFFRCNCWRELAENVAESLTKGARVIVTGRLQQRSWEGKDGAKRYEVEVQVDEVGPSLRWATAHPQKSRKSQGGGQSWGPPQESQGAPQQATPPQSGGGDWGSPSQAPEPRSTGDWGSPAPVPADEEGSF